MRRGWIWLSRVGHWVDLCEMELKWNIEEGMLSAGGGLTIDASRLDKIL